MSSTIARAFAECLRSNAGNSQRQTGGAYTGKFTGETTNPRGPRLFYFATQIESGLHKPHKLFNVQTAASAKTLRDQCRAKSANLWTQRFASRKASRRAQFLLDAQELVVLRDAVGTRG
jgi:hypothetical protein